MTRFSFLLSDSRSGSTFLARHLHGSFPNVAVTPEVSFLAAIRLLKSSRNCSGQQMRAALNKGRFFEALENPAYPFADCQILSASDFSTYVTETLARFTRGKWPDRDIKTIIVKKGHHAWIPDDLAQLFPKASFINLNRDPRAVYESKKRTRRPYRPRETMGWAGVALTTVRWRQYAEAMRELSARHPHFDVRYEDLSLALPNVTEQAGHFLGLPAAELAKDDYAISYKEQKIHAKSVSGAIASQELEAWRDGLTRSEIRVIDALARHHMTRLGYQPDARQPDPLGWLFAATSALTGVCRLVLRKLTDANGVGYDR